MKKILHFYFLVTFVCISFIVLVLPPSTFAQPNSENVTLIGRWPYGYCYSAYSSGNYVYFANGAAMDILDITNPNSINRVGRIITSATIGGIQVSGNYAYVANWDAGMRVIDISDPAQPNEIGSFVTGSNAWKLYFIDNT